MGDLMTLFFVKMSPRKWANILLSLAFLIWLVIIGFNVIISFESFGHIAILLVAIGSLCTASNLLQHWSNDEYISKSVFVLDKIVMYVLFSANCLIVALNRTELAGWFLLAGLVFAVLTIIAIINRKRAVCFHE